MTQGQGLTTEFKLRGIEAALAVSLRVSMAPEWGPRMPYWHVDLNSGSGRNDRANCIGSPIAFLNAAESVGRNRYTAIFCDHDLERITQLQSLIGAEPRAECLNWHNREVLPVVAERIEQAERRPQFAWGSVLVDPNGYFDEETVPHTELAEFAARFERIDLIFNLNIRSYRLRRPHVLAGKGAWAQKFCPSPRDFPSLFHRKHWLISNIRSAGGDQFCLFIGRSMRVNDHRALGMYHWESDDGRRILEQIEGVQKTADCVPSLQDVRRVPAPSDVSGDPRRGDEARQMDLL